ncbi:MAG: FAD-binding oxidoreductase [Burkholderiales bacterium]|nr:FAD-binding oxidoreductase [Burkholderiales bacterium]
MDLLSVDRELTRNSYYAATAPRQQAFPALQGGADCDVAVVGGGLAGLSAALDLAERGLSVVLLEAREIGWGASGRNGGQAIHGLACDQSTIEAQLGLDEARRVWNMSIEALDLLRQRIARHAIDCDWRDGYLGLATNARKGRELQDWAERMATVYGYAMQHIPPAEMGRWIASERFHSGIHDPRSGHLHPLKFTQGLARAAAAAGVRLHEQSPVLALQQGNPAVLRTAQGELRASHVLLAGNVYLKGLAPQLEPRIMPVGTYIACTERLDDALADSLIPSRSAVCDTNFVLDYFRTTNDQRMLYGGRVSYSTVTPMNLAESIRQRMVLSFPQLSGAKVEYAWGGFVDISMNRAPDFGRLPTPPGHTPNVYYLQGFSGHGLALTGLAGRLVAEAICGDAGRFDTFARLKHRPFPGGRLLRTPALVLGMAWYRMRDLVA